MSRNGIDGDIDVPEKYYNIQSVIDVPPPQGEGMSIMPKIFPKEMLKQEMSKEKFITIPQEVREVLAQYRPTPLVRAVRLERFLKLPDCVKIFYKREDVSPTGSHKPNTAIMQAYMFKNEGFERVATETGAGQWGSALSFACNKFGLGCTVYMVRCSYEQKPYRKTMMKLFGAEVFPSPTNRTKFGRKILAQNPNCNGSLGIAISEAIEDSLEHDGVGYSGVGYSLGSVLNSVLMHQTIIGIETKEQLNALGEKADVLVGCVGGGSNFGGLMLPFVEDMIKEHDMEMLAIEPDACPSITKGEYKYDYGDTARQTPLLKMYTLGPDFVPPPIHAGGLRYHGMAPIISKLVYDGIIKAIAYDQTDAFDAGVLFTRTEGIVPAPETNYAIKGAIDRALEAKKRSEEKTIVLSFSGHGFFDMKAYEDFLDGRSNAARPTKL